MEDVLGYADKRTECARSAICNAGGPGTPMEDVGRENATDRAGNVHALGGHRRLDPGSVRAQVRAQPRHHQTEHVDLDHYHARGEPMQGIDLDAGEWWYTVQPGDTLSGISARLLGDPNRMAGRKRRASTSERPEGTRHTGSTVEPTVRSDY
jgi:hypothetical protein